MMDQVLELINGADLSKLHAVLAPIGALLAVYVMSLTSHENEDAADPPWLRLLRRAGLALTAMAFAWLFTYSHDRNWKPWPPEVLLMFAVILGQSVRVIAIWLRIWREGHRKFYGPTTPAALRRRQ